jgi:hypothetical protein
MIHFFSSFHSTIITTISIVFHFPYGDTIPKQVCNLYDFHDGDMLSIEAIANNELRLRKN